MKKVVGIFFYLMASSMVSGQSISAIEKKNSTVPFKEFNIGMTQAARIFSLMILFTLQIESLKNCCITIPHPILKP